MSERVNEKEIVCVVCPNSCRLTVWRDSKSDEVNIQGFQCPRGKEYGFNEYTNPVRMLITTMRIENGTSSVIPVRSTQAIPKAKLIEAVKAVNESFCLAPIKMGDIVIKNVCQTGIDVVTSRDMNARSAEGACAPKYDEANLLDTIHHTLLEEFYDNSAHISETEAKKLQRLESQLIQRLKKFGLQTEK